MLFVFVFLHVLVPLIVVCSSTIWIGHLAKTVTQTQIAQSFEDFGQVKSVDVSMTSLFPPSLPDPPPPLPQLVTARACAYVMMVHRSDAARALNQLRNLKLNGNTCKVCVERT